MMKKLLVLMLVLGMASIANAGLIDIQIVSYGQQTSATEPIPPTDYIEIYPSDWVDLDIVYIEPAPWILGGMALDIVLEGPGRLDLSDLTEPAGAWDPGMHWITEQVPGQVYTIDFGMLNGVPGMGEPAIALDHILVHCEDEGDVYVYLIPNYNTNMMVTAEMNPNTGDMGEVAYGPGVYIKQIPEPMTVCLLGLGGLLLLRRRR
jgi:hypothetical protein